MTQETSAIRESRPKVQEANFHACVFRETSPLHIACVPQVLPLQDPSQGLKPPLEI